MWGGEGRLAWGVGGARGDAGEKVKMFAFSKEPLSMLVNSGQLPALFSMCLCMCVFSISAFGRFRFISFIFLLCFGILEFAYVFSLFFLTINLFVYLYVFLHCSCQQPFNRCLCSWRRASAAVL